MSKIAHYLQEHLVGEVMDGGDARRYFSTDASIFTLTPSIIVYPQNENDVRKTARFTWQLAERGRTVPITARGLGTDQSGAALGNGIVLVFPSHMNKITEFDLKSGAVLVQPGATYGKLQQTLHTHGRFLPPFPSSMEYSTIGGAVANNAGGEKSVKYGTTINYTSGLRVVLANGEVIETGRISKRELDKKLGQTGMEGDIYRAVDAIIDNNKHLIGSLSNLPISKNATGYNLNHVKQKDGSFDLTPLFVGSQGTLGIVTEATIETEIYNPETTLIVCMFDNYAQLTEAVEKLKGLSNPPSALELVNKQLIDFIKEHNVHQLPQLFQQNTHKIVLFVEFDDASVRVQKKMTKKAQKIITSLGATYVTEMDKDEQEKLWKVRHSAANVVAYSNGSVKALPFIEDAVVPVDKLGEYMQQLDELFDKNNLAVAVWGHAGDGNLHMQPFLDIAQLGDRQKIFKLLEEHARIVIELGGRLSGEHGDGRVRAPLLRQQVGDELYQIFVDIKKAFDPHGTLNPGVKIDVTAEMIKPLLRQEYSLEHLYDYMPRS